MLFIVRTTTLFLVAAAGLLIFFGAGISVPAKGEANPALAKALQIIAPKTKDKILYQRTVNPTTWFYNSHGIKETTEEDKRWNKPTTIECWGISGQQVGRCRRFEEGKLSQDDVGSGSNIWTIYQPKMHKVLLVRIKSTSKKTRQYSNFPGLESISDVSDPNLLLTAAKNRPSSTTVTTKANTIQITILLDRSITRRDKSEEWLTVVLRKDSMKPVKTERREVFWTPFTPLSRAQQQRREFRSVSPIADFRYLPKTAANLKLLKLPNYHVPYVYSKPRTHPPKGNTSSRKRS